MNRNVLILLVVLLMFGSGAFVIISSSKKSEPAPQRVIEIPTVIRETPPSNVPIAPKEPELRQFSPEVEPFAIPETFQSPPIEDNVPSFGALPGIPAIIADVDTLEIPESEVVDIATDDLYEEDFEIDTNILLEGVAEPESTESMTTIIEEAEIDVSTEELIIVDEVIVPLEVLDELTTVNETGSNDVIESENLVQDISDKNDVGNDDIEIMEDSLDIISDEETNENDFQDSEITEDKKPGFISGLFQRDSIDEETADVDAPAHVIPQKPTYIKFIEPYTNEIINGLMDVDNNNYFVTPSLEDGWKLQSVQSSFYPLKENRFRLDSFKGWCGLIARVDYELETYIWSVLNTEPQIDILREIDDVFDSQVFVEADFDRFEGAEIKAWVSCFDSRINGELPFFSPYILYSLSNSEFGEYTVIK